MVSSVPRSGNHFGVGSEQGQHGQGGGADGEAFGDGFGGVAGRVEDVGAFDHFLIHAGHFGDTAGIVNDGAVGVRGNDHAGNGEHTDSAIPTP